MSGEIKTGEKDFDEFYEAEDGVKSADIIPKNKPSIFNLKFSIWHILIVIILVILVAVLISIFKTRSLQNDIDEYKIMLQKTKMDVQKKDNYRRKYKKLKAQLTNIQAKEIDENAEYVEEEEIIKED